MLERNFERITIALIALLFFLGGCADWKQTTRVSLTIATQAAKSAETEAVKHYDGKCSSLTGDELEKCLNELSIVRNAFVSFYRAVDMALIGITLGDKQSAMEYATKALEMVKHIYKVLQTWLPDKIPNLPMLESTTPASQPAD